METKPQETEAANEDDEEEGEEEDNFCEDPPEKDEGSWPGVSSGKVSAFVKGFFRSVAQILLYL